MNIKNILNFCKVIPFGSSEKSDYDTVILGKKLPWEQYHKTGDYSTIMLTPDSFNVIISLTNLSEQEEDAIGNEEFEMYFVPADCVPFIVLKFGDAFKCDLSLNIMKNGKDFADEWINSESKTIAIYLLEGSDATLKCVRYFDYPHMQMLKQNCENQKNYPPENIDYGIQQVYATHSVEDLINAARCVDIIPEVEFNL